jgi:precorrin-6Y C5,15-methyltransferase (decarboxylating)
LTPWITIVGIGDDGLDGLVGPARQIIANAEVLIGGDRHQTMVADSQATRLTWEGGITAVAEKITQFKGRRVVVLATGDPMWFGAGANLSRLIDPAALSVIPHPGAFSLAAARMKWSLADTETISIHGRPIEVLNSAILPDRRILALSWNGDTAQTVARLLTERGFGPSAITVFEHLGGGNERRIDGVADTWDHPRTADLNTLAIECRAAKDALILPPVPGLPDNVFETDGTMTKCEVRAITIAALAPLPGQTLWEVGAGSGSVSIEWLRVNAGKRNADDVETRAIAVEQNETRCQLMTRNAAKLGVPQLQIVHGNAPDALDLLAPKPETIFVGGGISDSTILERCWGHLKSGGRLVANAVTIESCQRLYAFHEHHGGDLRRISISRGDVVGRMRAFRPMMDVIQYSVKKP